MKRILLLLLISIPLFTIAQDKKVIIDVTALKNALRNVKTESEVRGQKLNNNASLPIISLPMNDGTMKTFRVVESPIWEDAAAMKKADIRTYSAVSTENDGVTARFTITPLGFSGIIRTPLDYFIIEAVEAVNNIYTVYPLNSKEAGKCEVDDGHAMGQEIKDNLKNSGIFSSAPFPNGTQLRVYRLAAAATGEFTTALGSQANALAKITTIVNAIGAIYEAEAAMRFSLITATTNFTIIFNDATTDPFTVSGSASAINGQAGFNTMNTNSTLPESNYDVGHVFHIVAGTGGSVSGQAGPTPCTSGFKARGWTQMRIAAFLSTIVNIATHEIGHQFDASHTYNAIGGNSSNPTFCTVGWNATAAVEPGGGSTLMGYNSNCTSPNYTFYSSNFESYFHTKSLEQIFLGAGFNAVNGTTCGSFIAITNSLPVSNANSNYTIPKGTPFVLTGSATDADGDVLTYQWDEFDLATANDKAAFGNGITGVGGYTAVNSTASAPLFRSKQQTTPVRTFPSLTLLQRDNSSPATTPNPTDNEGEDLPLVARIMKFRLTVMDNKANGGGVDSDEMLLTINAATGPFLVTSQNTNIYWTVGSTKTISWSVNGTNGAPINCTNVKISLSTDNGVTFPTVLLASTANDGTENITVPNNLTSQGRIKIEAIGNIFFDMNNAPISIVASLPACLAETSVLSTTTPVNAVVGSATLNLTTTGRKTYTSYTANITATDPIINLTTFIDGSCGYYVNSPFYKVVPIKVTVAGNYTFSGFANDQFANLYNGSYNLGNTCTNFLASSSEVTLGYIYFNPSFNANLAVGTTYFLIMHESYSADITGSVTVNFAGPGAVQVVLPETASFYSYGYAIVNGSNTVVAVSATPNLSNSVSFPVGNYKVYGISYLTDNTNFTPYLNQPFTTLQTAITNNTICAKLSSDFQNVTVSPPCASSVVLNHPADDITSGTVTKQAAAAAGGNIIATNWVTGVGTRATYQAKAISLNVGFRANNGTVFKAEIGGCN